MPSFLQEAYLPVKGGSVASIVRVKVHVAQWLPLIIDMKKNINEI